MGSLQQSDLPSGPRILTMFVFLSDFSEASGYSRKRNTKKFSSVEADKEDHDATGTDGVDNELSGSIYFPILDVTIKPKVGRAILWPNVLDSDPSQMDSRTLHESIAVESSSAWHSKQRGNQRRSRRKSSSKYTAKADNGDGPL